MRNLVVIGLARARPLARLLVPLLIGAGCLWLLSRQMERSSLAGIGPAQATLPLPQWIGALAATALSFWALGRYDVIFHRMIGTGTRDGDAVLSGASSIAIAQVLGMGVLTGALVRWRILPGLSPAQATKIAFGVAVSFLICLLALVAIMAFVAPSPLAPTPLAAVVIFIIFICIILGILYPETTLLKHRIAAPPLRAALWMMLFSALDTAAAATALYLLLPTGSALAWPVVYMAYLLSLCAALFTGTPGGVGPFELVLLTCLPAVPEAELLAGIVAFRLIYYALPALLAIRFLAVPLRHPPRAQDGLRPLSDAALHEAPRAELGVCRQNGARSLSFGGAELAVLTLPQTVTALFDPLRGKSRAMLPALAAQAQRENRWPLVYKCSAGMALHGRKLGWSVLHIADEAVIDPLRFDPSGPAFRQLRRKLRQAEKAGICVARCTEPQRPELRRIDAEWQAENGAARGLSMGRFCPGYLRDHHIYIARHGDEIVGFISLHANAQEVCLDLMRTRASAPNGTVHLMIQTAISQAAAAGYRRFSLAALPCRAGPDDSPLRRLALRLTRPGNAEGLARFKSCFAPRLQPLYAMAPHGPALALGLADLALAIRRDGSDRVHDDHEENAFAPAAQT
ncbi:DUF2156 domain-containing protein [Roseovarius faecimaris]|uniref:DUF2156 domain-containing protein n=1 Tax=Roseovarius faecimaris TaxID=2494550 RepID=A0A6I6IMR3_9RHOB|nr:phosphatidylglycerol lysyltransferase domain-containing protein [Roseovarius faecimaris]QGX98309.1 DUF2156 domain-containing protein [Roseovarius faecimaris]